MKRKTLGVINKTRTKKNRKVKGASEGHLQLQLEQFSKHPFSGRRQSANAASSTIQNQLDSESDLRSKSASIDGDAGGNDKDFILSQDFFCTPDYITPDNQNLFSGLDFSKEHSPCPRSPVKLNTVKNKRCWQDSSALNHLCPIPSTKQRIDEVERDAADIDETMVEKAEAAGTERTGYVSQSAVALRCRAMPPPCLQNPYLMDDSETDLDPFRYQRSKCASFFPGIIGGSGLSRYITDFHEIQQIGAGNFSRVYKVLKRLDGCLYAVKHSTRHLHQESERQKALMEVQAMAALGFHENIVGYHSSWYENNQLYIQLELCDQSLSKKSSSSQGFTDRDTLVLIHHIAKALQYVHAKGIAHLDVKPDNIYVKKGIYKLGDFGCATRLDKGLEIEEGDARYMPQEILNEDYDHLDKVDIFSLGATAYELMRGSPLADAGNQFLNIKEGKLALLPTHSLPLQHLLKAMLDPDPTRRPSARELLDNHIFDRI